AVQFANDQTNLGCIASRDPDVRRIPTAVIRGHFGPDGAQIRRHLHPNPLDVVRPRACSAGRALLEKAASDSGAVVAPRPRQPVQMECLGADTLLGSFDARPQGVAKMDSHPAPAPGERAY